MELAAENYIKREYTNIIKGLAIIIMFAHHFLTFPEWIIQGVNFSASDTFADFFNLPLKICVSLFAFLTGYFYYFRKKKTVKYSVKKATDIYLYYLIVLGIFIVFAYCLNCYQITAKGVITELLIINRNNMTFGWYALFYIIAVLVLPFYSKRAEKNPILTFCLGVVIPNLIALALNTVNNHIGNDIVNSAIESLSHITWFSCVASGYLFAQKGLFQKMDIICSKRRGVRVLVYLALMILPFLARKQNDNLDIVYAPLFIFGLVGILRMIKHIKILYPISFLGKYSLLMWLLHSIFFNVSKQYTQPVLYYLNNPVLVLLTGLVLCLAAAVILTYPVKGIIYLKDKLFKLSNKT